MVDASFGTSAGTATAASPPVEAPPRKVVSGDFRKEILAEPGGEHLTSCSPCGTCVGTCPIPRRDPSFNPRRTFYQVVLGLREDVLSSKEIWMCSECDNCYSRCPKQIHISELMKSIRNVAIREGYQRPGPVAAVNVDTCTACGTCVAACPYEAISLETVQWNRRDRKAAQVNGNLCMSCGICNAVCPSSSISVEDHADEALYDGLVAAAYAAKRRSEDPSDPKLLVIVCNWCLRAHPDLEFAAVPPRGIEVINVPCSGRVSPSFLTAALNQGIDGVLVVGCKENECHFKHGNQLEKRRLAMMGAMLGFLGIDKARMQFAQMGLLDRDKLPGLVDQMLADIKAIAPRPELAQRADVRKQRATSPSQVPGRRYEGATTALPAD